MPRNPVGYALHTSLAVGLALLLLFASMAPAHAQSGTVWRVDYYANPAWAGAPTYTAYSNVLSHIWGTAAPGPGLPTDNWTARMTSEVFFYAGIYRLTIVADDEFALVVDDVTYFSTLGEGHSGKAVVVDFRATQGLHSVQIDFREYTGGAYFILDWAYVKNANGVSPVLSSTPPAPNPPVPGAPTVVTRYGDYTRCIQQNLHQAECFQSSGQWNSPNLGSIQMEPKIVVWENCPADAVQTMQLYTNQPPQPAKCSRTAAGWFPS